ncbi:hypothetical protein MMC07_008032 [Pseudocyphellaria aurata]|nr:hypothetical protein [Pseudocyphellaria aurata]
MTNINSLSQSLVESVAGFVAGVASTLVSHPLDVIKTRLQIDRTCATQLGGSIRTAQKIIRSNEGAVSALYRGLTPNLVGNSVSWALYFACYEKLKHGLQSIRGRDARLSYYDFFLASGAAGTLTAVCTNPIWVIKTRMLSTSSAYPGAYRSIADGTRQIFRSEGLRGFYRGMVPSLFGVSHGALQFMAYERLKLVRRGDTAAPPRELGASDLLLLSGLAKVFAGIVSYPYQVVRSRLQMYNAARAYEGARDVIVQVWRHEGMAGFYKGLGPYLLRVMPSTWTTFLVYEKTKLYLPRLIERE